MINAIARLNILGLLSIKIKKIERSDSTNIQSSIFNSGLPGLGCRVGCAHYCKLRLQYLVGNTNPIIH